MTNVAGQLIIRFDISVGLSGSNIKYVPIYALTSSMDIGWLLRALIVAVLTGLFNGLPYLVWRERNFFLVSVIFTAPGLTFIWVSLESLGSMVVSVM